MSRSSGHWLGLLALMALGTSPLRAQCPPHWLPGDGVPGTDGDVDLHDFALMANFFGNMCP